MEIGKKITTRDALSALDSLDDYSRMTVGIAPAGAIGVLLQYIKEHMDVTELSDRRIADAIKDLEWCAAIKQ